MFVCCCCSNQDVCVECDNCPRNCQHSSRLVAAVMPTGRGRDAGQARDLSVGGTGGRGWHWDWVVPGSGLALRFASQEVSSLLDM